MDGNDKYVGRILDNRYEILELIGTGGMALVYRARCHRLNRMVAIKILKEDLAGDEDLRRRFHTESQAVAMLSHPNIVAVYDVSRSGSVEYIVMELIEGITLKQYINRKGLLNWKEALHFATQVTKALSHAHSRGIIHRDIKPHNIMILKDGSVKVADFGIAQLLSMQNTLTQEALGSVHYISPEQAKGGHVDARSDIYSLGVVMYEMLTSRLPFVGESAVSVAIQHISAIPLMPRDINPDIPVGLEDITMHAMEPDINLRFTTADEMLRDLEEFRKNPSLVYNYTMSDPEHRQASDIDDMQETRIIPKGYAAKPESVAVKPETPVVRHERMAPAKKKAVNKAEMTADEYRSVKTRATNTSTLVGIFSIIVFIVIVSIFMWNYLLKGLFVPSTNEQITIPTFINRRYEDVLSNEEYRDLFSFTIDRFEYSDVYPTGYIIDQDPAPERPRNAPLPGRKISVRLVVSNGEEPPYIMPNLIGLHYADAKNQLDRLDLNLSIIDEDPVVSETMERGYVIETRPAANDPLSRGNVVVIIRSAGPEIKRVIVPDYVGKTKAQLEDAFKSLELVPDFRPYHDNAPEGTVLFIANVNQEVVVPATIVVHISLGPEVPDTPATEEPTTTDEPPVTEEPTTTDEPPVTSEPPVTDEPPVTGDPPPTDGGSTDEPPAST